MQHLLGGCDRRLINAVEYSRLSAQLIRLRTPSAMRKRVYRQCHSEAAVIGAARARLSRKLFPLSSIALAPKVCRHYSMWPLAGARCGRCRRSNVLGLKAYPFQNAMVNGGAYDCYFTR
jgi:hypothetical protein